MSASYQFTSPWTEPYQNAGADQPRETNSERENSRRATEEALDTIYNFSHEHDMEFRVPGSAGHLM